MSKIYIAKEVKANYASSSYPDSGASKATTCIVNGSNTYQYRSFLQHDFSGIPCGSKIISAKLYVYASEGNDNTAQGGHKFDAVISEWEEGSNTWNNQASVANTPIPAEWLVPTIGAWNNWDITELVQKWIYQVMPNNGLMFVNKDETGYRHNWKFYNRRQSEEYATYVEVEYEPIEQWCISHERMVEIADAIRDKTGKTDSLTVEQMVTEIEGISGGIQMNFAVVGSTTEPQSPIENTIWVNTEMAISEYVFSATSPTTPIEGMVWLQTGTVSTAPFNALKSNNITIEPNVCKQYISGAWIIKQAKTFQNGAWVDWQLYIYKTGAINSIIDNLKLYAYVPSTSSSSRVVPNITFNESSIKLALDGDEYASGGSCFAESMVDLTDKNNLKIKVLEASTQDGGYVRFGATKTKQDSFVADVIKHIASKGESINEPTIVTIDISSLSGEYYLFVTLYGAYNKTVTIAEWWLE